MRIVQFSRPGGPETLEVVEVPEPQPGAGTVRVAAEAIGVGATDVAFRKGTYPWNSGFPAVPGIELAGRIDAVGAGVSAGRVGERVLVSARESSFRGGCYAEKVVVPAEQVFDLPDNVGFADAAALANAQVAWHLLELAPFDLRDKRVVVMGAAGGVGGMAVKLAKYAGAKVLAVASSPSRADSAKRAGADDIVIAETDHAEAAARVWNSFDVVVDHLSGPSSAAWVDRLAVNGVVLTYGFQAGSPGVELVEALAQGMARNVGVRMFSMHSFDERPDDRRAAMRHLIDLVRDGALRPEIGASYPLTQAVEAHRHFEERRTPGKVLLVP